MKKETSHFVTKWAGKQIKLPLDPDGVYDFTVDWGDGAIDQIAVHDQSETMHTYKDKQKSHTVTISGTIEGFGFYKDLEAINGGLLDVLQWGNVKLHNKGYQFAECKKLKGFSAKDVLYLSNVTHMGCMFYEAISFNQDLSNWDVSSVIDMNGMFCGAMSFNQDISTWDVSNVTRMYGVFFKATSFNQDLSKWDVSSVINMDGMFSKATSFNQSISTWDVSNVTRMYGMFSEAASFNQDISKWDVGRRM